MVTTTTTTTLTMDLEIELMRASLPLLFKHVQTSPLDCIVEQHKSKPSLSLPLGLKCTTQSPQSQPQAHLSKRPMPRLRPPVTAFHADVAIAIDQRSSRRLPARDAKLSKRRHEGRKMNRHFVDDKLLKAPIPSREVQESLAQALQQQANARIAENEDADIISRPKQKHSKFDVMYHKFVLEHGDAIKTELGANVTLSPAPLCASVQTQFANVCSKHGISTPNFAYHGTLERHFDSIFTRGLLVPHDNNGIVSRNGLTHGRGVYLSNPGSSWLSKGFCDSSKLLVVAYVDPKTRNEKASSDLGFINYRKVHRETPYLREVGDATIMFDGAYTVPIMIADTNSTTGTLATTTTTTTNATTTTTTTTNSHTNSINTFVSTTNTASSTSSSTSHCEVFGFSPNKVGVPKWSGTHRVEIMIDAIPTKFWVPAEAETYKRDIKVKRRQISKRQTQARAYQRNLKAEQVFGC